MHQKKLLPILSLLAALLGSRSLFAAGYEKAVMESGKYAGIANAATSSVHGAESLYFNPAGLPTANGSLEVSGDLTLGFPRFTGQFTNFATGGATPESTGNQFVPSYGAFVSYNVTPQWAFGAGVYIGAGSKADYGATQLSPFTGFTNSTFKTFIGVTEFALGTGYEILPGLKLGVAWRVVRTNAAFATSQAVPGQAFNQNVPATSVALVNTDIENLTDTKFNGYRVGAQYTSPDKVWGVGATYRSAIQGGLTGTVHQQVQIENGGTPLAAAAAGPDDGSNALVYTELPPQITLGANYAFIPTVRGFLQYDWTPYHDDAILPIGTATFGEDNLLLGWNNEHEIRAALECTAVENWAFRVGYAHATQVTPNELALPNIPAPAAGNTIAAGVGTQILNHMLDLDGAFEYTWANGTATGTAVNGASPGSYVSDGFFFHLGATYRI